jgi:hypothetical protein
MLTSQITILKLHKNIFGTFDLCLVWSSSTFLPTLKYHRLCSFSSINFELPLNPFKIQLLMTINGVFVGPTILDYPKNSLDTESLYEHTSTFENIMNYIFQQLYRKVVYILNVSNNQSYSLNFFHVHKNTQR